MKINTSNRDSKIVKEYLKGKVTMQSIADSEGISRQRVEQILRKNNVPKRPLKQKIILSYICSECKKNFKTENVGRKYCSSKCSALGRRKYKTPEQIAKHKEELRIKNAKKANFFYHNIFKKRENWRDIVKDRNNRNKK